MHRVPAPAKLTLSLRITGRRSDGYHLIDAEMVTLALGDELEIDPEGDSLVVVTGDGSVRGGPENLVSRALAAVRRTAGVTLHKFVPAGSGLGGGSADAAAILRWAGCRDLDVAAALGADVPFCLVGGRARVRGIGEIVEPMDHVAMDLTLLVPPVHCSTPEVYAAWDELGCPRGDNGNDLETAALAVAPELRRWARELSEATGEQPRLAGSGSTWWVRGSHPGPGRLVTTTVPAL